MRAQVFFFTCWRPFLGVVKTDCCKCIFSIKFSACFDLYSMIFTPFQMFVIFQIVLTMFGKIPRNFFKCQGRKQILQMSSS